MGSIYPNLNSLTYEAPKPPNLNWRHKTRANDAQAAATTAPLGANAFRTFLSDPEATDSTHSRYISTPAKERVVRKHGGKRRNLQRWGGALLQGVYEDDLEIIEDALAMPLAHNEATIVAGAHGAPFSFAGEAIVSVDQVQSQRNRMIAGGREMAHATRRFYSESEWDNIERHLAGISDYFPSGAAKFERVEIGDTAFHIAVRHGSFSAAGRLLVRGFDPLARNGRGESVASLLDDQLRAYLDDEKLTQEPAATADAVGNVKQVKREKQRRRRCAIHEFARALHAKLEEFDLAVLEPLSDKDWRAKVEGRAITLREEKLLSQRNELRVDLKIIERVSNETAPMPVAKHRELTVRTLFAHRPTSKSNALLIIDNDCYGTNAHSSTALTSEALATLGKVERMDGGNSPRSLSSFSTDFLENVDVDQWLVDLDHAALLVQSAWRSYRTRIVIVRAVKAIAAAQLQARFKRSLDGRHNEIERRD